MCVCVKKSPLLYTFVPYRIEFAPTFGSSYEQGFEFILMKNSKTFRFTSYA